MRALTAGRTDIGGVASFVGLVRDTAGGDTPVGAMTLEHYPGMTERELAKIEAEAHERWPLAGEPDHPPRWPPGARRSDRPGGHGLGPPSGGA